MKKCLFLAVLSILILFESCSRSAQNYVYIPIVADSKGKLARGQSETFQAFTDSQAVIMGYAKYCIARMVYYKLGKELKDTLDNPYTPVSFFVSTSIQGDDISKMDFVSKDAVWDSLYNEIVKPAKDSYLKQIRQDEEYAEMHRKMIKNSVRITSYYLESPNSASGVDAVLYYKNLSKKTIKYFYWTGHPINAVGDVVTCDIRDYSNFTGKETGPIKPGQTGGGVWDCAWYNWTAKKLILTSVEIEYMDGSRITIDGDNLYIIGKKK